MVKGTQGTQGYLVPIHSGKHFPRLCWILQSSFIHPKSPEVFKTFLSSLNCIFMHPNQIQSRFHNNFHAQTHFFGFYQGNRPQNPCGFWTKSEILDKSESSQTLCSWCHLQRLITVAQGPQLAQNLQAEAQMQFSRTAALFFFMLLPTKVIP